MASRLEQDLSCPICSELFRDPVILSCSHSFCKLCLENWWKDKPMKTCPVCKRRSSKDQPPVNLALKNLVETFAEEQEQKKTSPQQPECSLHSEKLRLFCVEHQELICLVCRDSRTHRDHSFSPIEEAAEDLRGQLRSSIRPLQDKLKVLDQCRAQFELAVVHISAQARGTETQIRDQFDKLHQFLKEEEDSRMKALREEEEQKTQRMKDKMAALSRDIEALSQTISETEEQLRAADVFFLLQYKTAVQRVQHCPLVEEPQLEPGALINQAKHLGNLGFNIWRNMKSLVHFYPVLLDPNTATTDLVLSEDLSSVRGGETEERPQNPERREGHYVYGSEEFTSGTHSWDVQVSGSKDWYVGVGGRVQSPEDTQDGDWGIGFTDGEYAALSHKDIFIPLFVKNLKRVRVKLDFDTKTVSFSDPDTNTELHTFTNTAIEWMNPVLSTTYDVALKILPKDITITVNTLRNKRRLGDHFCTDRYRSRTL